MVVMAMTLVGESGEALAGGTRAQQCEAAKILAAGDMAQCLAREQATALRGGTAKVDGCEQALARAFAKAERSARPEVCPTEGDTAAIEVRVNSCMADIASALAGNLQSPPCPPSQLVVTGQTTCWNSAGTVIPCLGTGQDGDIKAGVVPQFDIFPDEGTIVDLATGLMWEIKSNDGSIHDVGTSYTWDDAFAVHIAKLNTPPCFAGHCDWRLPNIRELLSIVDYQATNRAVQSVFDSTCVAGCTTRNCSCTATATWSSTSFAAPEASAYVFAWGVDFGDGRLRGDFKGSQAFVRAVRSGL